MADPENDGMDEGTLRGWISRLYHQVWRRRILRSGWATGFLLASVLIGLTLGYRQHIRGNFHKLKEKMADERVDAPVPRPGGQEAVTLTRTRLAGDSVPEFLSVTLLPGRGMNVLQITAYIPGKGEVNLLASPTIQGAATAMTGMGADVGGRASLTMGGAFEAPWAGRIWGTPAAQASRINTTWQGHTITLRTIENGNGSAAAWDGLILAEPSDEVRTLALPDGGDAEAEFHSGDFGGQWPSKTDLSITALLDGPSIDLTMDARNTGDEPEPIGLGWAPRFAIVGGNREQLRLRIPAEMRVEHRDKGMPTGVLVPVKGTSYDFLSGGGARLGSMGLDDCYVELQQNLLDNGPFAELSDPADNFGLRLTVLSSSIKAMRVDAPADAKYVSIEPQYNYPDPFGREWKNDTDTGMVVLQPGGSTRWKVRLEIYSLTDSGSAM